MAGARIRAADRNDIPTLLALWEAAGAAVGSNPPTAEALARLIAHTDDAILVAEKEDELVGAVIAAWDGWRGNLYRLAVPVARRQRGLGRALVEAAQERLAAKGATRITALVAEGEPGASEFWRDVGYERDPHVARYVRGR